MVILVKANLMNILEVILMTEIDVNLISEIFLDYDMPYFIFLARLLKVYSQFSCKIFLIATNIPWIFSLKNSVWYNIHLSSSFIPSKHDPNRFLTFQMKAYMCVFNKEHSLAILYCYAIFANYMITMQHPEFFSSSYKWCNYNTVRLI